MAKRQVRKIGEEIVDGIREIKRGEIGRIIRYLGAETRDPVDPEQAEPVRSLE